MSPFPNTNALLLGLALGLLALCAPSSAARSWVPEPRPVKADSLVGAYYFPGWSDVSRWYCIAASETAQHPLLGYYREGDPDAADWHIKWALEHGISFFAFDFYTSGGSQMLETALDEGFLKAKYIDRFKFCLNWCNHAETSTMTDEELDRFGELVVKKYLTHPSYLRIDGKPVVMILIGAGYVRNLGVEGAKKAFGRFERKCVDAGLPGVYLVFCEGAIGSGQDMSDSFAAGCRAFCRYNFPYAGTDCTGPGKHAEATYEHLLQQGKELADHWRKLTGGRFWPTVMPGWDRRPWTKDNDLIRTGPTPEIFGQGLRAAKARMNSDRIVMIEAWNEWGEGSVLEPSVEHGFAYLDQVREVFCPNAGDHRDDNPRSLGLRRPVFDLDLPRNLPSVSAWRFDFDTQGWTGSGVSGLTAVWGALTMTTTTTDPQITSPVTYLACKDHPRMRIRMRATPVEKGSASATGQVFWSTIDKVMGEQTSIGFAVPLDGQWHDYDLDLASRAGWTGRADRLRLDPVDAAGVKVEVDEISL